MKSESEEDFPFILSCRPSAFATLTLHNNFHTRKITLPFHIADPTAKHMFVCFFYLFLFVLFFDFLNTSSSLAGNSGRLTWTRARAALPIPISATHSYPVCPNTACSQSARSTTTTTTTITITTNQPSKGMQLDKSVQLYVISQRQLCSVSEFAQAKGPGDNLPIKSAFEHLTNCFQITARGGAGPAWPISPVWTRHAAVGQFGSAVGPGRWRKSSFCQCAFCSRHTTRVLDVKLRLRAHGGKSYIYIYIVCIL